MPPRRCRVEVGEPPGSGASAGRVQRNVSDIETLDARPFGQLQTTTDHCGEDASTFHHAGGSSAIGGARRPEQDVDAGAAGDQIQVQPSSGSVAAASGSSSRATRSQTTAIPAVGVAASSAHKHFTRSGSTAPPHSATAVADPTPTVDVAEQPLHASCSTSTAKTIVNRQHATPKLSQPTSPPQLFHAAHNSPPQFGGELPMGDMNTVFADESHDDDTRHITEAPAPSSPSTSVPQGMFHPTHQPGLRSSTPAPISMQAAAGGITFHRCRSEGDLSMPLGTGSLSSARRPNTEERIAAHTQQPPSGMQQFNTQQQPVSSSPTPASRAFARGSYNVLHGSDANTNHLRQPHYSSGSAGACHTDGGQYLSDAQPSSVTQQFNTQQQLVNSSPTQA